MKIQMAGVDFNKAPLEQREKFTYTKTQAAQAMRQAAKLPGVKGCVIFSTCNRTELWIETDETAKADAASLLCSFRKLPRESAEFIVPRGGGDAAEHLFETACGLKSQIFGEDQILAQIKDAIAYARKEGTASEELEKLFQLAVTSAKKVKTQVKFASGGASVATAAADMLREHFGVLSGARCLIIGNGEMGRLMARQLTAHGARVTMTLRQYKYGVSVVPEHCETIDYDERVGGIADADIVVSATSSPHYTIHRSDLLSLPPLQNGRRIFVDLAVPRDIEPGAAESMDGVLFTIDDIHSSVRAIEKARTEAEARAIIRHYIREFYKWQYDRSTLPTVQRFADEFSQNLSAKLADALILADLPPEKAKAILQLARNVAENDTKNLLFAFRDSMRDENKKSIESTT